MKFHDHLYFSYLFIHQPREISILLRLSRFFIPAIPRNSRIASLEFTPTPIEKTADLILALKVGNRDFDRSIRETLLRLLIVILETNKRINVGALDLSIGRIWRENGEKGEVGEASVKREERLIKGLESPLQT